MSGYRLVLAVYLNKRFQSANMNRPALWLVALVGHFLIDFANSKHFDVAELCDIFKEHFPSDQIGDCKLPNIYNLTNIFYISLQGFVS